MPEAQLAELITFRRARGGRDDRGGGGDVCRSAPTTEAETESRKRLGGRDTHGGEHGRRGVGAGMAGRPGRSGDLRGSVEQLIADDPVDADIQGVGQTCGRVPVEMHPARERLAQPPVQVVT